MHAWRTPQWQFPNRGLPWTLAVLGTQMWRHPPVIPQSCRSKYYRYTASHTASHTHRHVTRLPLASSPASLPLLAPLGPFCPPAHSLPPHRGAQPHKIKISNTHVTTRGSPCFGCSFLRKWTDEKNAAKMFRRYDWNSSLAGDLREEEKEKESERGREGRKRSKTCMR